MIEFPKINKKKITNSGYCYSCQEGDVPIYEYSVEVSIDDNGRPILEQERACEQCGDNLVKYWKKSKSNGSLW